MYKSLRITTIIPCLNEEVGIERVLRAMPEFVDEVIVVDNNSTDRTSEVAVSLGAKVVREEVRGYVPSMGQIFLRRFQMVSSRNRFVGLDSLVESPAFSQIEELCVSLNEFGPGQLAERRGHRRAVGADEVGQALVVERQRDDDAVGVDAAPPLGQVPEGQ